MADLYATERVYIMIKNFSQANAELIWEGNLAPDMVENTQIKKSLKQQIKLDKIFLYNTGLATSKFTLPHFQVSNIQLFE